MAAYNCLKLKELIGISRFKGILRYSTSVKEVNHFEEEKTHYVVDYLVNSLGFSTENAVAAAKKLPHWKSAEKPDSVISFFRQNGLEEDQIKRIVSSVPKSLSSNVEENLKPKFRFLQDFGLSKLDLVKVMSGNPIFFTRRLGSHIIPHMSYYKELLGSEQDVVRAIRKSNWLLSSNDALGKIARNVSMLKGCGFSNEEIKKLLLLNPRILMQKPEVLEEATHRAVDEYGIPRQSLSFLLGVYLLATSSKSTLEMKFEIFRSCGWTDSQIYTLARKHAFCLFLSEAKIRDGLKYFMGELEFSAEYLANHPVLLALSLKKRILPRNEILKTLKEKKLVRSKLGLYAIMCLPEAKFIQEFLLPYKDDIPNLCEAYLKTNRAMSS